MSKLREMFVDDPPSLEITARLQASRADVCEHNRNPCYLRCGVRFGLRWEVIPKAERVTWLRTVIDLAERDRRSREAKS